MSGIQNQVRASIREDLRLQHPDLPNEDLEELAAIAVHDAFRLGMLATDERGVVYLTDKGRQAAEERRRRRENKTEGEANA